MRPIKFRRWTNDHYEYFTLERFSLEQFTGLLDKNGKEIYEHDIVAYRDAPHLVEFVDGCFVISHKAEPGEYVDELGAVADRVEVIGNIHEQKKEEQ